MSRSVVLTGIAQNTVIHVVAGILRDASGRVLIAERRGDPAFSGQWEFPGGKVHAGESAHDALRRELEEELGTRVVNFCGFQQLEHAYPDRAVRIEFFLVNAWHGAPRGLLGQSLRWCDPFDVEADSLLPADAPVLTQLRKQRRRHAA